MRRWSGRIFHYHKSRQAQKMGNIIIQATVRIKQRELMNCCIISMLALEVSLSFRSDLFIYLSAYASNEYHHQTNIHLLISNSLFVNYSSESNDEPVDKRCALRKECIWWAKVHRSQPLNRRRHQNERTINDPQGLDDEESSAGEQDKTARIRVVESTEINRYRDRKSWQASRRQGPPPTIARRETAHAGHQA